MGAFLEEYLVNVLKLPFLTVVWMHVLDMPCQIAIFGKVFITNLAKWFFFKQYETFSVTLWYIFVYLRFSIFSITLGFFIFRFCIFSVILGFFRFRFGVNRFCCRCIILTVQIRNVLLKFFFGFEAPPTLKAFVLSYMFWLGMAIKPTLPSEGWVAV